MTKSKTKVISESVVTLLFFNVIGVVLWQTQGHIFFLFNFLYIGFAASFGELLFGVLPRNKKVIGRKISQLLIGLYMLVVLGFLGRENMQIEGFIFYLLGGIFSGPVLHYLIAKIGGTFLFGRGWCGWACWTAMVLDFLPWMRPKEGRLKMWGVFRYVHFVVILALVLLLWFAYQMNDFGENGEIGLRWLLVGNIAYYIVAVLLAIGLKDNRAFCKYVCPIPILMKVGSRFSVWKISINRDECIDCGACETNCPMNIKLLSYMQSNKRVLSTECISCLQCVNVCPQDAIKYAKGYDFSFTEHINYKA